MKKIMLLSLLLTTLTTLFAQHTPKGLNVNDLAPNFTAVDQNGKRISLQEELKHGPVVVLFYRGQWCPYCNKQLKQMQDSMGLIQSKGARILAITPEKMDNIGKTVAKTNVSYSILHDEGLQIMKNYDVSFAVDAATVEKYQKYGIDFSDANGAANGANLPVPAVYIINQKGKISYRFFDTNYSKRPSVKEIAAHL